jgi:hypothetical protein
MELCCSYAMHPFYHHFGGSLFSVFLRVRLRLSTLAQVGEWFQLSRASVIALADDHKINRCY